MKETPKATAKTYLALLTSVTALSQAAILIRLAKAPAEAMGFWRMIFALVISFGILILKKEKVNWLYVYEHRKQVLLAGFLFWLHFYIWFYAVHNTTVANVVVLFNINPIIVSLVSVFLFKEKPTKSLLIALGAGLTGILIIQWGSISIDPARLKGDLLAIAAATAFAGYTLSVKSLRSHKSNALLTLLLNMMTSTLFFAVSLIKGVSFFDYPSSTWFIFVLLAIVPSLLGHSLYTYSLKYLKASVASCFKLLEPGLAALVATFLFAESVSMTSVIGFLVIAAGLLKLYLSRE